MRPVRSRRFPALAGIHPPRRDATKPPHPIRRFPLLSSHSFPSSIYLFHIYFIVRLRHTLLSPVSLSYPHIIPEQPHPVMAPAPSTALDKPGIDRTGISQDEQSALHAVYTSPRSPTLRTFYYPIATASRGDVSTKHAYLVELRGLATTLQGQINTFLTERMEEDRKAASERGQPDIEQEAREEQNYGEEAVEDDA
jgi:Gon7 family